MELSLYKGDEPRAFFQAGDLAARLNTIGIDFASLFPKEERTVDFVPEATIIALDAIDQQILAKIGEAEAAITQKSGTLTAEERANAPFWVTTTHNDEAVTHFPTATGVSVPPVDTATLNGIRISLTTLKHFLSIASEAPCTLVIEQGTSTDTKTAMIATLPEGMQVEHPIDEPVAEPSSVAEEASHETISEPDAAS